MPDQKVVEENLSFIINIDHNQETRLFSDRITAKIYLFLLKAVTVF